MPVLLIVVALLIIVGAILLLRDSPAASANAAPPGAVDEVRTRVIARLRERLAGWDVAPDPENPAKLAVSHTSPERRVDVDVGDLAGKWDALVTRGEPERAEELIERFVTRLTTSDHDESGGFDAETARQGLAILLVRTGDAPSQALQRRAGPLTAVLVLRNPSGPEPLGEADLSELGLTADAAFDVALQNHAHDVEDGPLVEVAAGTDDTPLVIEIGTGDPLSASLSLTSDMRALAREQLEAEPLYFLAAPGRFYAVAPTAEGLDAARQLAGPTPLLNEPVSPESLALRT